MNKERNLNRKFHEVSHKLHRMHYTQRSKNMIDPNRGQGRIIKLLQNAKQMSQKELAFILDIRTQSLGETLSKLEAANYVTRTPNPEDKRMMMVTITEAGMAMKFEDEQMIDPFEVLNEDEQEVLSKFLDRVLDNIETNYDLGDERDFRHRGHGRPGHRHPGHGRPHHGGYGHPHAGHDNHNNH